MKANKKRSAFSAERSKGKLLQDLLAVFPDGRSVTVQRNTAYFNRMFIAVLYKDERTAPRGQNAVRQCLRPGRVQADFLYSGTIKCAIERFIEPTCQIIGTAPPP